VYHILYGAGIVTRIGVCQAACSTLPQGLRLGPTPAAVTMKSLANPEP
jgi:hypothetical protein